MPLYPQIPIADPATGAFTYIDAEGIERVAYDPSFDPTTVDAVGQTQDWERTLEQRLLYRHVLLPCREITATGNVTLTNDDPSYIFIDGNGSNRDLTLPTEFTGLNFFIMNISDTETITVKDDDTATVATLTAGTFKTVIYSGSAWRAI